MSRVRRAGSARPAPAARARLVRLARLAPRSAAVALAGLVALGAAACAGGSGGGGEERAGAPPAAVTVRIDGAERPLSVEPAPDGSLRFVGEDADGGPLVLAPEELARRARREQESRAEADRLRRARPWWQRLLNVETPAGVFWVGLGFLAQAVFASRMIVQWLASERRGRSVVPVAFWWLSLAGASMLLVYFAWRRDPVGILGQTTGWLIYTRNLWLVYRGGG